MIKLKQFVTSKACLSCDGCCRYSQRETVWAPLFFYEEILELTQRNILPSCLFTHAHIEAQKPARINLVENAEMFTCPCFDIKKNMCRIYEFRPLDCQLYPFLLLRKNKKAFLALDQKCPYTKELTESAVFKEHVADLVKFFSSDEFTRLAQKNPEFFQEYLEDIKVLEPLPGL